MSLVSRSRRGVQWHGRTRRAPSPPSGVRSCGCAPKAMTSTTFKSIGIPGRAWTAEDRASWRKSLVQQRSYVDDVQSVLEGLRNTFDLEQYGELDYSPQSFRLFALKSRDQDPNLPTVLVTGGVHGYETSGVHGALAFVRDHSASFAGRANLIVVPCVSPWSYEVVQRWNHDAQDPNRSFFRHAPTKESGALMDYVDRLGRTFAAHIDLHETTDSDESEFRPALAARDGLEFIPGTIPDGFYVVDDSASPCPEFQAAIIDAVARVTHIAPADDEGEIIGSPVMAPGVIQYPLAQLGLCASLTGAPFTSTTEVYPDSPRASPEICNAAQVAAVCAAIEFVLAHDQR